MRLATSLHLRHAVAHATSHAVKLAAALIIAAACVPASLAAELKSCTGAENSSNALRECSALLQADGGLDGNDRIAVHLRRGQAWLAEDEPLEAVADFTRILSREPTHEQALTLRAKALTALARHADAAADWTALIGKASGSAKEPLLLQRAATYRAAANSDGALADYDAIIAANPKSLKAYVGRGNVFAMLKERDKALAEFAAAEAIDPADTAPHIARAEAAEGWGDTKMAIENYMFVAKNNTRSAGPYRKALQRLGVDTPP